MTGALGVIGGAVVAVLVNETSGLLEWIVLAAAAATGMGILRHKVFKPVLAFAGRVDNTLEDLRGLPELHDRIGHVEEKVDDLARVQQEHAGRLASVAESLGSLATSERLSIRRLLQPD